MTATTEDALEDALALLASAETGCCKRGLLSLLREDAPVYRGRGTVEAERLRAFIMARAAKAGLADDAMAYILEELETGTDPFSVAAAARAARSARALPGEIVGLLASAIERIRHVDEFVDFDSYPAPPDARGTTATAELIMTLASIGSSGQAELEQLRRRASASPHLSASAMTALKSAVERVTPAGECCCPGGAAATSAEPQPLARSIAGLQDVELQNQHGVRVPLGQVFEGRVSVVAFFYTRCMNPEKCSRTIGNLARLDALLRRRGASAALVAGITYDPQYDTAERLLCYGAERGMHFGPQCQLFRSTGPFDPIRDAWTLGVGYGSSTVNRHRLELILIDPAGKIVDLQVRRLWDPQAVADAVEAIRTKFAGAGVT